MADEIKDVEQVPDAATRRYAAFISYSHTDEEIGDWLHKRLETYRVPPPLVGRSSPIGPIEKRLGKVFRDRTDLSAAHDLTAEIRRGLERSDALVVLCSPRSCVSKYVNEEILYFKELGKSHRIFAAIVDGEPHAAGRPGYSSADECFPPAMIYRRGHGGSISSDPEPNEPIAADFRGGKDGRENGSLKLIAGLLGLGLDDLIGRERAHQRRVMARLTLLAVLMTGLAVAAVWFGTLAEYNRTQANKALAEAFVGRAWENLERGNLDLAARYALAGWRSDSRNRSERRAALAQVVAESGYSRFLNRSANDIREAFFASNGSVVYGHTSAELTRWDSESGALLGVAPVPDNSRVWHDRVSLRSLVIGADGHAVTFDLVAGHRESEFQVPTGEVLAVWRDRADWRIVLKSGADLVIWNSRSDNSIILAIPAADYIAEAIFSPDGNHVAALYFQGENASLRAWNARSGRTVLSVQAEGESVETFAFSPDSQLLAANDSSSTAAIWAVQSGQLRRRLLGHLGRISMVRFTPDSANVLTASEDATARLWFLDSARPTLIFRGHSGAVTGVTMSDDGSHVATVGQDRTLRIWNAESGEQLSALSGHTRSPTDVTFSPDGRWLMTRSERMVGGTFDTVRLWNADAGINTLIEGRRIAPETSGFAQVLRARQTSEVGTGVLTLDDRLVIRNLGSTVIVDRVLPWLNVNSTVVFDDTGSLAAVRGDDGRIELWDIGSEVRQATIAGPDFVQQMVFSGDGSSLLVLDGDATLWAWAAASGERQFSFYIGEADVIAVSADGRKVASGGNLGSSALWNPSVSTSIPLRDDGETISTIAFSVDGDLVATAGTWGGSVRVYDANDGRLLVELLSGDEDLTFDEIAFSRASGVLVATTDSELLLWDHSSRRLLTRVRWPTSIRDVALSRDSSEVYFATSEGALIAWNIAAYSMSMPELAERVCTSFLVPGRTSFSPSEIDADPLISAVWQDPGRREHNPRDRRNVCAD